MIQAGIVRDAISKLNPNIDLEIIQIITSGDRIKDKPLYEIGGKALFVKELEEALLNNEIDIAVHSLKDVPAHIHPDLELVAFLEREDAEDALVSTSAINIQNSLTIGTSSPRRIALIKQHYPHLKTIGLRGNVDTRITKLKNGEVDLAILALAGLKRLSLLGSVFYQKLDPEIFVPCVGQGIICVQARKGGSPIAQITHQETAIIARIERAFLEAVDGTCRTPLGAYAQKYNDHIKLTVFLSNTDCTKNYTNSVTCGIKDGITTAKKLALKALEVCTK